MNSKAYQDEQGRGLVKDFLVALFLVLVFTGVVRYRSAHPELSRVLPTNTWSLLGAEYDSIARAIRKGRGFSDPFEVESGPTAWMTPVLPYLLAGLYWGQNDDRTAVVEAVVALQLLSNLATGFLVLRVARSLNAIYIGYLAVVVVFVVNFFWLFQRTHDVWLLLLAYNFIWLGALKLWSRPATLTRAIGWGSAGGIIALCSPVAGFSWAIATVVTNLGFLQNRKQIIRFAAVVVASIAVVSPWTIRNRLVFEHWIPIKSNFPYEVWQAQCVDDDGVLDSSTFSRHPWPSNGVERQQYLAKGEKSFISDRWPKFADSVARSPGSYVQRVLNRFTACTWYYETTFQSHEKLWVTRLQRGLYWVPFLGLLLTVALKGKSQVVARGGDLAVLLYVSGLVVYVLFSYYQRYSAPLAGIQMLMIVYGFGMLKDVLLPISEELHETEPDTT